MRLPLYVILLGGGTVVQSSLITEFPVAGVTPDLPLVITALLALARGPEVGLLTGFCLGLLQDGIGGGLLGIQALSKAVAGLGLGLLQRRLQVSAELVRVSSVVVASMAEGLLRFFLLKALRFPGEIGEVMVHGVLPQALYNGVVASLVVAGFVWARERRQE
jgi:rod shape-determining protein MreD